MDQKSGFFDLFTGNQKIFVNCEDGQVVFKDSTGEPVKYIALVFKAEQVEVKRIDDVSGPELRIWIEGDNLMGEPRKVSRMKLFEALKDQNVERFDLQ